MFTTEYAPLAQLDRASVYGTEGWGFELLMVHHEVIIRIVSSSQVIGSDLFFISSIQTKLSIKKGLRVNRKPFAVFIISKKFYLLTLS